MGLFKTRDPYAENLKISVFIHENTGILTQIEATETCKTNLYENGLVCGSLQGFFYVVLPNRNDPYGYCLSMDIFETIRTEVTGSTTLSNELQWYGVITHKWIRNSIGELVRDEPRSLFFQPASKLLQETFEEWRNLKNIDFNESEIQ